MLCLAWLCMPGLFVGPSSVAARLLNAADNAYMQGDLTSAIALYQQSIDAPADATPPRVIVAATTVARFRSLLAEALLGDEDAAYQQLSTLQNFAPGAPLTRLAAQFWDQYSMTADAGAACNELGPYVSSQAGATLRDLRAIGILVEPEALCSVPRVRE